MTSKREKENQLLIEHYRLTTEYGRETERIAIELKKLGVRRKVILFDSRGHVVGDGLAFSIGVYIGQNHQHAPNLIAVAHGDDDVGDLTDTTTTQRMIAG